MSTYQTEGIVLKRNDYKENDRRYSIFTRDRGKISVVAKGTRKFSSKLSPHLEPFAVVDLLIAKGKMIDKIAGVERMQNYKNISLNSGRLTTALAAAELVEGSTRDSQPDEGIFNLLAELYTTLDDDDETEINKLPFLLSVFGMRLLVTLGFEPQVEMCVKCHKNSCDDIIYFSYRAGGMVCVSCFEKEKSSLFDVQIIDPELHKIIHWSGTGDFSEARQRDIDPEHILQLQDITYNLLINNLEKDFQAFKALSAIISV